MLYSTCFQVFRSCWMDIEQNVNCCTWSNSTDNLGFSVVLSIPRKWKYMCIHRKVCKWKWTLKNSSILSIPMVWIILYIYVMSDCILFNRPAKTRIHTRPFQINPTFLLIFCNKDFSSELLTDFAETHLFQYNDSLGQVHDRITFKSPFFIWVSSDSKWQIKTSFF